MFLVIYMQYEVVTIHVFMTWLFTFAGTTYISSLVDIFRIIDSVINMNF